MDDKHDAVKKVERLLQSSGVTVSQRQAGGRGKPQRGRAARWRRWALSRLLLLLAASVVALALLCYWSTGTATDPIAPPGALLTAPRSPTVDSRFGIVQPYEAPRQAAMLPIGWERMPFWWKELQKTGPESWDPFATDHDRTINQELSMHRHIVGLLINTPDWAAAQPSLHGASPPKGLYLPFDNPGNYWGHFVGLIARRYAGRIDDWIIWNEVNIPSGHWHTWGGTTADYAQLLKVAYLAAKAANPRARIILAGDPYWYDHGAFFADLLHRLSLDRSARASNDYFDITNLHLYSRPTDVIAIVKWYRSTMRAAGVEKPIWISETNAIPYDDTVRMYSRGGFRASLDDQASFVVQALALDIAEGVQRVEINRMIDGADFAAGGEPFGLVRNDGSARPEFYAYRTVATLFAGATGGTVSFSPLDGVYIVTLRRPGATVQILWDQRPRPAVATVPVSTTSMAYDKFGQRLRLFSSAGTAHVHLARATGNTDSADPADYVIGGNPIIVVTPTA